MKVINVIIIGSRTIVDVVGGQGPQCVKDTAFIEDALKGEKHTEKKPEFDREIVTTQGVGL